MIMFRIPPYSPTHSFSLVTHSLTLVNTSHTSTGSSLAVCARRQSLVSHSIPFIRGAVHGAPMHVCGFQSIVPSGSFARVGVASAPSTTTTTRPFGAGTLHTTIKRIPTNGIPEIVQAGMPRTYDKKTRLIVSILLDRKSVV